MNKFKIGALVVGGVGVASGLIYKSIKSTARSAKHMAVRGHHIKRK